MKVPTYDSKAPFPTQGRGQFLTAQLDAGAMMAPARAFEAAGVQTASMGDKIAAWGFKRGQINAESQAEKAIESMTLELDQKSNDTFNTGDLEGGPSILQLHINSLTKKYRNSLTTNAARKAFAPLAAKLRTKATVAFAKKNNERVIEAEKENINAALRRSQLLLTDLSARPVMRKQDYEIGRVYLEQHKNSFSPKEFAAAVKQYHTDAIANTLAQYINESAKQGYLTDPLGIVKAFRDGRSNDIIIDAASKHLTTAELSEIADKALVQANRIVKMRKDMKAESDKDAAASNHATYLSIVNTDFSDKAAVKVARENLTMLTKANYFETPAKREAVEKLFEVSEGYNTYFPKRSAETDKRETELLTAASQDTLTYENLNAAKREVTKEFYFQQLSELEREHSESTRAGIQHFKEVFRFSEYADKGELTDLSRQAFSKASILLRDWAEKNRRATREETIAKAESIASGMLGNFQTAMRARRIVAIISQHSRLRPEFKKALPTPTKDNFDKYKQAVTKLMAKHNFGGSVILDGILKAIAVETEMRVYD